MVPNYSGGPVGPKIVEAALNWLTPLQTMYNKKWPIKPIKVPFKNQSNGCTAYLKPIRHCTEVRLLCRIWNSFNNFLKYWCSYYCCQYFWTYHRIPVIRRPLCNTFRFENLSISPKKTVFSTFSNLFKKKIIKAI